MNQWESFSEDPWRGQIEQLVHFWGNSIQAMVLKVYPKYDFFSSPDFQISIMALLLPAPLSPGELNLNSYVYIMIRTLTLLAFSSITHILFYISLRIHVWEPASHSY